NFEDGSVGSHKRSLRQEGRADYHVMILHFTYEAGRITDRSAEPGVLPHGSACEPARAEAATCSRRTEPIEPSNWATRSRPITQSSKSTQVSEPCPLPSQG